MVKINIDKEYIGAIIGPGGKVIQEIQRETGTTINIEEVDNRGEVSIFSKEKVSTRPSPGSMVSRRCPSLAKPTKNRKGIQGIRCVC